VRVFQANQGHGTDADEDSKNKGKNHIRSNVELVVKNPNVSNRLKREFLDERYITG
jgi:hypothetical protein